MSLDLNINWTPAVPYPTCGYRAAYRRNQDAAYNQGTTSGSTIAIPIDAPACYEGTVYSDCCNETVSIGIPFGVNSYVPFNLDVNVQVGEVNYYGIIINSAYPGVYDTIIDGSFDVTVIATSGTTTVDFEVTRPAGQTHSIIVTTIEAAGSNLELIFSNILVNKVGPIFDNGGALQQADPINTPPYSKFYWDGSSGNTYLAQSPISLPSFLVIQFDPTEVDTDSNILAGNLHVSFILSASESSVLPFNSITFQVDDNKEGTNGSVVVSLTQNGLIAAIIPMVKVVNPLDKSTAFSMKAIWPDTTIAETKTFYLPEF